MSPIGSNPSYGLLRSLVVSPGHEGQGLAASMLRSVIARGYELGLREIYLSTGGEPDSSLEPDSFPEPEPEPEPLPEPDSFRGSILECANIPAPEGSARLKRYVPEPRLESLGIPRELERSHERDQVALGCVFEIELEHPVEELDRILERQEPTVMEIGRRILDSPQREGLDQAFCAPGIESLDL